MDEKKHEAGSADFTTDVVLEVAAPAKHQIQRVLKTRHITLFSIGSTIGTAVFVSIGNVQLKGGPLFLLLGYSIWCSVMYCVNEGQGIMVCSLPIEAAFSRFATRYVDDAFGAATAWNYYLAMCSLYIFEITALHSVIGYWADIHPAIIPAVCLVSYFLLHCWSARWFGESEVYIVMCKIVLMLSLFMMTFVTMLGGNPIKDRYGFRNWRDPGPISDYYGSTGPGYLRSFWACILGPAFAVAGPDFLSLIAGEAINPRKIMPRAFKTVFFRLIFFFVLSALAVGILVGYDDEILKAAVAGGAKGAGASPYVAAMTRMKIRILPHIVNAGIATSIYSAGSGFLFAGSRTLHGLAMDGYAPRFLRGTNKNGVPIVAVCVTLAIGCLSFLQVSAGTSKVLDWFINISTASQVVTWWAMAVTFLFWNRAAKAQNLDRSTLPYKSIFMPYGAYYALIMCSIVILTNGYTCFMADGWNVPDFLFAYASPFFFIAVAVGWKIFHRSMPPNPSEIDLFDGIDEVEQHEADLAEENTKSAERSTGMRRMFDWVM